MRVATLLLLLGLAATGARAQGFAYVGSFGSGGTGPDAMINPVGLALAPDGSLWVALASLEKAKHFSATGTYLGETVTPISAPTGVAVLANGEIAVSCATEIALYSPDGSGKVSLGLGGAYALVAHPVSGFWASQQALHRVFLWPGGGALYLYGTPAGFAVLPDGTCYIANYSLDRIDVRGGPGPAFDWGSTGGGNGQFRSPADVEIADDLVYVADSRNHRVQVFTLAGAYVAQFGTPGSGPGQLLTPGGVAVAPSGTIYVSELGNNRISMFEPAPVPAHAASWGRIKSLFR